MAGEETILDAPVTPAPLFAYRALRGMLFGSPETPVLHPLRNFSNDHNKENEANNKTSFTKPKIAIPAHTTLTPLRKRKVTGSMANSMLSPTKSCLRTPGAATPRRELLRDVNVTFMDASIRSISPELVRKDVTGDQTAKEQKTISTIAASDLKPQKTTTRSVRNVPVIKPPAVLDGPVQSLSAGEIISAPDFNVQTYMSTTEKEMKKLIRYSQKMREYARKQDEDNTKLKQLVEELQKENARLKRKADAVEEPYHDARPGHRAPLQMIPDAHRQEPKRRKMREDSHQPVQGGMASTARPALTSLQDNKLNSLGAHDTPVQHHKKPTPQPDPMVGLVPSLSRIQEQQRQAPRSTSTESKIKIPLRPPPQQPASNTTIPTNASLAPDRLAAARARIRQRSEIRKASNTILAPMNFSIRADQPLHHGKSHTPRMGRTEAESQHLNQAEQKRDSSMLDWAGL